MSTSPVEYAPHPYYSNHEDSLIVDMSFKFTKLANDLQSQLVHCVAPPPGEAGKQLKYVIDPIVPDQFRDEILNAAEHVGFPLVVPKSPFITHGVAGGPASFEMSKQFTHPPPPMFMAPNFASQWSSGSSGPSSPFEMIKQKIKQKNLASLATSAKANGPKSYASAAAGPPMIPPNFHLMKQQAATHNILNKLDSSLQQIDSMKKQLHGYIAEFDSSAPADSGQTAPPEPGHIAAPSVSITLSLVVLCRVK